jgi:LPS-assembly protein
MKKKYDKYFFSEGFFNLKDKSHIAKKTKINLHKDIFDDNRNDPRLYGSSSFSDEKKTIVHNGVFTSCKINNNCPPWSIKAKKITHDKINQDLIYKNAILKIYDVPVLYFPKFFHPDPSVKRRSGFLRPQSSNSESLGSSLYIPYFKTLGYDKDITFKPTIFDKRNYIIQNEFRKVTENSSFITDFSFLRNYKSSKDKKTKNSSHLVLDYTNNLNIPKYLDSELDIHIEKVTNDTYLKVFQNPLFDTHTLLKPSSLTQMQSDLTLYLEKENQNLTTGIRAYEKLGVKNNDRYQYTLPYYGLSKNLNSILRNNSINGSLNFSSSGSNNLKNTNNLVTKVNNSINYSSTDYISKGFKNTFDLYFTNSNIIGKNDPIYNSDPQINGMSMLTMDTTIPLIKYGEETIETIDPKISFRVNPGNNMKDHSGESKSINIGNVFDLHRLGLSGDYEAGKSLTLGIGYKLDPKEGIGFELDPLEEIKEDQLKDKFFEFRLATILRDQYEAEIPSSSTTHRKHSDIFGGINNRLFENVNNSYTFSIDNDYKTINSHNFGTEISINNFITSFNYVEKRNELGSTHLISNNTKYKVNENSSFVFSTRRNKEINLTEYYNLSYEYKNDCLTAALKFNKTFYQDNDLVPSEDLFFTITLFPLTTYEKEIYKKIPGSPGLKGWFR